MEKTKEEFLLPKNIFESIQNNFKGVDILSNCVKSQPVTIKTTDVLKELQKMKNKELEICIDFDGTCVSHEYPEIGKDIGAIPVLKKLVANGHKLILFTMRSGKELDEAAKWFEKNEITLYGVNENPTQKKWTSSPKAYGQIYIDDAALGCPLIYVKNSRPYVNWGAVENFLIERDWL